MTQDPPPASDVPQPSALIEQARARLAAELERLPHWESPALWLRLRAADPRAAMTLGALTERASKRLGVSQGVNGPLAVPVLYPPGIIG